MFVPLASLIPFQHVEAAARDVPPHAPSAQPPVREARRLWPDLIRS